MKNRFLSLLVTLCLLASPVLAATTHYGYVLPVVGGSQNTWGTLSNTIYNTIDSNIWSAAFGTVVGVNAPATSGSNITLTNPINNVQNISFNTTGKALILPAMNGNTSVVAGGLFYVNNVGSNAFEIFANDGTTAIVTSLTPGQTVSIQLLAGGTANGTFQVYGPFLSNSSALSLGTSTSTASPAITGDTTSGFYTAAGSTVGVVIGGTNIENWTTAGITVPAFNTAGLVANSSGGLLSTTTALPDGTTATTGMVGAGGTIVATQAYADSAVRSVPVITIQKFTAGGTYTPNSHLITVLIECVGAGGGGGAATSGNTTSGGGGGSGEYSRLAFTATSIGVSQTVTIGAGGTAGTSGGSGGSGGNSSVGSLISAGGGSGGGGSSFATISGTGGSGGSGGTGDISPGASGGMGFAGSSNVGYAISGYGAGSFFGSGGSPVSLGGSGAGAPGAAGGNGTAYGSGGAGAVSTGTAENGGSGAGGECVFTEYNSQ